VGIAHPTFSKSSYSALRSNPNQEKIESVASQRFQFFSCGSFDRQLL
jgi:hypothetical protein